MCVRIYIYIYIDVSVWFYVLWMAGGIIAGVFEAAPVFLDLPFVYFGAKATREPEKLELKTKNVALQE